MRIYFPFFLFFILISAEIPSEEKEEIWTKILEECKIPFARVMASQGQNESSPELELLSSCIKDMDETNSESKNGIIYTTVIFEELKNGETCFNTPVCIRPKNKN